MVDRPEAPINPELEHELRRMERRIEKEVREQYAVRDSLEYRQELATARQALFVWCFIAFCVGAPIIAAVLGLSVLIFRLISGL